MTTAIEIVCVCLPAVVAVVFARWKRTQASWRPLLPGIVVTGVGVGLIGAVYLWVFQTGTGCAGVASFTCRINANQGVLTLLTIFLAAVALWTTVITRALDRREALRVAVVEFFAVRSAAIEEVRHNLIHVAMAFDDGHIGYFPQLRSADTEQLAQPRFARQLSRQVHTQLDALVRNFDRAAEVQRRGEYPQDPPEELQLYTRSAMHFLGALAVDDPDLAEHMRHDRALRDLGRAGRGDRYTFAASHLAIDLPTIRTNDQQVFCWWKDSELDGVAVFEVGSRIRDYQLAAQGRH